ncbi:MAG: hypothetical protein ACM31O_03780 [Bacteroidota bacterium]
MTAPSDAPSDKPAPTPPPIPSAAIPGNKTRRPRPPGKAKARQGRVDKDGRTRTVKGVKFDAQGHEIVPPNGRNKIGRARNWTDQQIAAALRATGGYYTQAAMLLAKKFKCKCNRQTIARYVERSVWLQRVLVEINEATLDFGEAALMMHIRNGSERSVHYLLSSKGGARGYGKNRTELSTQGNKPLPLSMNWAELPPDILDQLADVLAKQQSE